MRRFIVLALLFLAMAVLNGKDEVAQECVCKEGEENCSCPELAQEERSVAKTKVHISIKTAPMPVRKVVVKRKVVVHKLRAEKRQLKQNHVKIVRLKKALVMAPPPKKKVIRERIVVLKRKNVVLKAKIHIHTKKAKELTKVITKAKLSGKKVVPVPVKLIKKPTIQTKKVISIPFAVRKVNIEKGKLKNLKIQIKVNKKKVAVLKQKAVVAPPKEKAKLKKKIIKLKQKEHVLKIKIVRKVNMVKKLQKGVKIAMRTNSKVVVVPVPVVKHKKYTIIRSYKLVPVETATRKTEYMHIKYQKLNALNKAINKRIIKLKVVAQKAPPTVQPKLKKKIAVLQKKQAAVKTNIRIIKPYIKEIVTVIKHKKLVKMPIIKKVPIQEKPVKKVHPPKPIVVAALTRKAAKCTLCRQMFTTKRVNKEIKALKFKIKVVPPKQKQVLRKRLFALKKEKVMIQAKAKIAQFKKEEASKRLLKMLKKKVVVLKAKVAQKLQTVATLKQKFKAKTKKLRKIQMAMATASPQRKQTLKRYNKVARAQFVQAKRDLKAAIKVAVRYVAKTQRVITKAKKRVLILAKERCRTLVAKLAKSQQRVEKVAKQLKKHCQKTAQKIPRPALIAAGGLQKIVAKGTKQALTLKGKIKVAIATVLQTGKKVSIENCRELEAKLRASAARAKLLEKQFRTSCQKSLKKMPPKLKAKIHKLKTTLGKVSKRASLLKTLVSPTLARPATPVQKRYVRRVIKKVAKQVEKKINIKIKTMLQAAKVAPPPERKVILKKVKFLARNKKYIAKKIAVKKIAASKPLPPPVYRTPLYTRPIYTKPAVMKPARKFL